MREEMWFEELTVVQEARLGTNASLFFLHAMKAIWFIKFIKILWEASYLPAPLLNFIDFRVIAYEIILLLRP